MGPIPLATDTSTSPLGWQTHDLEHMLLASRELGVPMRFANLVLAEMTEALNRGWGGRDSRSVMLLQQERAGIKVAVDPEKLREAAAAAKSK